MGFSWPRLFLTLDPAGPDPGSPKIESRIHECHPTINIAPTPQCQLLVSADTHPAHRPKDRQTATSDRTARHGHQKTERREDRPRQRHNREGGKGKDDRPTRIVATMLGGEKSVKTCTIGYAWMQTHTHMQFRLSIGRPAISVAKVCRI